MWKVCISSGEVFNSDGESVGHIYSGHGEGVNNPAVEDVSGVGPIPIGKWRITQWLDHYESKGPTVAKLQPVGHDAYGRMGFLIHGDNKECNRSASHGCIIAARTIREEWRKSGDKDLEVVL